MGFILDTAFHCYHPMVLLQIGLKTASHPSSAEAIISSMGKFGCLCLLVMANTVFHLTHSSFYHCDLLS